MRYLELDLQPCKVQAQINVELLADNTDILALSKSLGPEECTVMLESL